MNTAVLIPFVIFAVPLIGFALVVSVANLLDALS